ACVAASNLASVLRHQIPQGLLRGPGFASVGRFLSGGHLVSPLFEPRTTLPFASSSLPIPRFSAVAPAPDLALPLSCFSAPPPSVLFLGLKAPLDSYVLSCGEQPPGQPEAPASPLEGSKT